jgi:hypothetical protein
VLLDRSNRPLELIRWSPVTSEGFSLGYTGRAGWHSTTTVQAEVQRWIQSDGASGESVRNRNVEGQPLLRLANRAAEKVDTKWTPDGPAGHKSLNKKPRHMRGVLRRRRPESNRCSGFCRPVPKPLGHVASTATNALPRDTRMPRSPMTEEHGADEGIRTLDLLHGKQTL